MLSPSAGLFLYQSLGESSHLTPTQTNLTRRAALALETTLGPASETDRFKIYVGA